MDTSFWHDRWQHQQIGFHQTDVNVYLKQHWKSLNIPNASVVMVPLCGKTLDMMWLLSQGYSVVGIELSKIAVRDFFKEQNLIPSITQEGEHALWQGDKVSIWQGDFFNLPPLAQQMMTQVDAVYDRAALVALPAPMRQKYISTMKTLMPHCPSQLLLTFEYPQHEMNGPPFSVTEEEVRSITQGYGDVYQVHLLAHADGYSVIPRFREKGVSQISEKCFLLSSI